MGKKNKAPLTEEEKFYRDLINVLYEGYNSNINIHDQNMLFYAAKKFLQGKNTSIYNEFKDIIEKPERERDEADKFFIKFFQTLNRQGVSPNPTLENFMIYVKSYVDTIKTKVGNIYYTPRLNSGVTVGDKGNITEDEKERIARDLKRPARINTLLEMADKVNGEIEETLHTINNNIVFLFGKFNATLGNKQFREFINKYYKYQQDKMNEKLPEEERIVAEDKQHLLIAGYQKMVEDLYFVTYSGGKNADSSIQALKTLDKAIDISKRDKIVRRETEPLIELLKKMSKEEMLYLVDFAADDYTSFLNMNPQVLTKVLTGEKDLSCFMEFYGLTNDYLKGLNIGDGKFTTDEIIVGMYLSKDETAYANILQQIDPLVQEKVEQGRHHSGSADCDRIQQQTAQNALQQPGQHREHTGVHQRAEHAGEGVAEKVPQNQRVNPNRIPHCTEVGAFVFFDIHGADLHFTVGNILLLQTQQHIGFIFKPVTADGAEYLHRISWNGTKTGLGV